MYTKNITNSPDSELSSRFKNDSGLNILAKKAGSINELKFIADDYFIYTNEQLSKLEQDFFDGIFD